MDGKNIREVTSKGVTYVDDDGQEQFIDFEVCYQNYLKRFDDPEYIENIRQQSKDESAFQKTLERKKAWREIGIRNVLEPPWADGPYIEFYTEPPLRFKFASADDYRVIRAAIAQAGWQTHDLS